MSRQFWIVPVGLIVAVSVGAADPPSPVSGGRAWTGKFQEAKTKEDSGQELTVHSRSSQKGLYAARSVVIDAVRLLDANADGAPDFLVDTDEGTLLVLTRAGALLETLQLTSTPWDGEC